MNLILIAALVAVAGADKLDRAYLPPASAKTAGGSADHLKTPFAGNSFNNGLGGLPKGSYTNDFQGVVVDAVAPGTRASEGESGLGAPRISYGSTASRVGAAAFKGNQAGFRQPADGFQTGFAGSAVDGQVAGTEITQGFQTQGNNRNQFSRPQGQNERSRAALDREASIVRFESDVGAENFNYAFETDNGITAEESGVAVNGVQAQGAFSYTGDDGQVYSVTYTADEGGYQPKGDHLPTPPPIPEEILRSLEQNARDEAAGLIDDGSYDAQKYNAEGDYSESDGANGRYSHQSSQFGNRGEADATASGTFISQNNQPFARPGQSGPNSLSGSNSGSNQGSFGSNSGQFGQSTTGPTGSDGFSGQASGHFGSNSLNSQGASNNQASGESEGQFGTGNTELSGQSQQGDFQGHFGSNTAFGNKQGSNSLKGSSNSQGNKFTTSTTAQVNSGFGQGSNGFTGSGSSLGNRFSASASAQENNGLGESSNSATNNQRLGQNQGNRFSGSASAQGNNGLGESSNSATNNQRLGQNQGNRFSASASAQGNNGLGESSNSATNNQRLGPNQGNVFGNRNEYLPPVNHFGSNVKQPSRPQASLPSNQQSDQQSNTNNQNINVQPLAQQNLQGQVRPQSSNNGNSQFARPTSGSEQKPNNFNAAGSTQTTIGNKNEYLPPFGQNRPTQNRPTQNRPQSSNDTPTGPQFNNFNDAETSANFQSPVQNRPQNSFSSSASISESSQSTFEPSSHQSNSFQRPQANARPNQPTKNQIPSFGSDKQSQFESTKLPPQQGTSQPDTELTTPFENSGPQYSVAAGGSKPTPSTPTSRPQSFNAGSNIAPTSPSSRPSFGSQPSAGPQRPGSRPFAQSPAFPTQPSEIQYEEENQFSNRNPQPSQINGDAQFSPSTQRPSFAPQGADDSYYYKQPSKPFNTPQDSRFPSASSNKFDSVSSSSPSYSSHNNRFPVASQQNAQSQSGNFQGHSRYPQRPTVPSLSPTTSSQPSNGFTGITQAAISSFPSETPTQATQFTQQGQFGSRPGSQTNNFGQSKPSKPSFGQTSAQASTGIQASSTSQGPANSRKPSFQGQQFSQQTLNQDKTQSQDESESRPSQQYNGEIYEYKKPAQTLPAPDSTDSDTAGSSSGQFSQTQQSQFGRRPSQPQFGQAQSGSDSQSSSTSQFSQGSRPQFGSPSRSQFGQSQQQGALNPQPPRHIFGAQPSRPFGGSSSQTQNIQSPQPTQFSASASAESSFSQSSQPIPTQSSQFGRPQGFQSQFGSKNPSFAGSQGFKQNPTTSNFAGKGEEFGGPRPPPSFNPQTGYTY